MPLRPRTRSCTAVLAAMTSAILLGPMMYAARATDKISVAVIPIADCAPIYLGKAKGFFAAHGLDIELSTQGGGAAIIPGVLSGQVQIGFSNIPSLLIAQTKGLNFIGIAPGAASSGERGHDFSAIIAPGDSSINNAKDLQNKTVAVNNLNNIGDISVRASVRAAGGDPKTVKFIEVPFPDMPASIADHRIEAGWVVEPFLTISLAGGAKVVDWNLVDVAPKMMIAAYFTSDKYSKENPDIVKRFKIAILEVTRLCRRALGRSSSDHSDLYADHARDRRQDHAAKMADRDESSVDTGHGRARFAGWPDNQESGRCRAAALAME